MSPFCQLINCKPLRKTLCIFELSRQKIFIQDTGYDFPRKSVQTQKPILQKDPPADYQLSFKNA